MTLEDIACEMRLCTFIFGALCPSKSGLMNKHIVKHIIVAELEGNIAVMYRYLKKQDGENRSKQYGCT